LAPPIDGLRGVSPHSGPLKRLRRSGRPGFASPPVGFPKSRVSKILAFCRIASASASRSTSIASRSLASPDAACLSAFLRSG
jgi:hypothetical protein